MNTTIITQHTTKYKNSPLGLIPEDWEVKKLSAIAELTSSKRVYLNDYVEFGVPFYRGKEISLLKNRKKIADLLYISEERYNDFNKKFGVPKVNDILITAVGTLGNVYRIINDEKFYFKDGNLIWLREIKENSHFLEILLSFFSNEVYLTAIGSSQKALTIVSLSKLKLPIPQLHEQEAIANCLSTWDQAIEKQTTLIAQKELSKKALMQQLLSGKKRLKGFNGEWKEVKLGQVCNLVNGMAFKPSEWANSGIPIIRIQNLNGSSEFNLFDGEVQSRYLVNHGDLLFAWSGSRGTSFGAFRWFKEQAVLNQHIFNVLPKNGLERDFAFQLLRWLTIGIERKAHGSAGLVHVTKKQLEDENMKIPTTQEEQTAIANVLQCADDEIQLLKKKLDQLKEQKKGLMQMLLTGKKRLKYKNQNI